MHCDLRSAQPRNVTPAGSASSPTPPAAPRARSSTPCSRGCTTCGTAARPRPTARPATVRACSCRCRRGAPGSRWSSSATRQRGVRSRRRAGPRGSSRWSGARYRSTPARSERGALASMPRIEQLTLSGGDEMRAYRARRRAERTPGAYIVSLSFRTVTYKALCAAEELARFYPDLRDPSLAVPFGIFHQRFSTNTAPSWERAQPFRLLCHNGEINAIQGNANWMRARGGELRLRGRRAAPPGHRRDRLRLGDAGQRARAARPPRPRRPPRADDARSRGVGRATRARSGAARLLPLPLAAGRAVGRAGRARLHRRPRGRRRARPQRSAAASLRGLLRRPRRLLLGGGRRRPLGPRAGTPRAGSAPGR